MRYRIAKTIAFLLACVLICFGIFEISLKMGVFGLVLFVIVFISPKQLPFDYDEDGGK